MARIHIDIPKPFCKMWQMCLSFNTPWNLETHIIHEKFNCKNWRIHFLILTQIKNDIFFYVLVLDLIVFFCKHSVLLNSRSFFKIFRHRFILQPIFSLCWKRWIDHKRTKATSWKQNDIFHPNPSHLDLDIQIQVSSNWKLFSLSDRFFISQTMLTCDGFSALCS